MMTTTDSINNLQWTVKDISPETLRSFVGRSVQLINPSNIDYGVGDWTQLLQICEPSIIHIVEYNEDEKYGIKARYKEHVMDEDWINRREWFDTVKQERTCWVCRWIQLQPYWIIKLCSDMESTRFFEELSRQSHYRISGDWHEHDPMDGIDIICRYPVWINEKLLDNDLCRQRLLDVFDQLNNERQDHHPSPSPVEDIVDPDLLSYRPFFNAEQDNLLLRNTYQWVPSKFLINNKTNEVNIVSPICHLENRNGIYNDVATVFSKMLPMFREIKCLGLDENDQIELQVIVKVQSYNIKPGMKYSGRWHTEGQTENIVAGGVYYLHVDSNLQGGALKFRSEEASPSTCHETNVYTGCGIVFENCTPHRFRQMHNLSNKNCRRTFLNFFIVDLQYPIPLDSSNLCFGYYEQIYEVLNEIGLQVLNADNTVQVQRQLCDLIIEKILSFLPNLWLNIKEAKQFRQRVREEMLQTKSGWGWMQFGNSGIVQFIKQASINDDSLRHTESD
ncbi:hypothetical protein I4U23_022690 [Adineta vaga]|nr:hypothetical protein I4U23_022690 [Adineta vaga]